MCLGPFEWLLLALTAPHVGAQAECTPIGPAAPGAGEGGKLPVHFEKRVAISDVASRSLRESSVAGRQSQFRDPFNASAAGPASAELREPQPSSPSEEEERRSADRRRTASETSELRSTLREGGVVQNKSGPGRLTKKNLLMGMGMPSHRAAKPLPEPPTKDETPLTEDDFAC